MNASTTRLTRHCFPLVLALSLLSLDAIYAQSTAESNKVLRLDGDGDYVQLPADIFNNLEEATVEAWVKWGDFSYYSQWFAFGSGADFRAMGVNQNMWFSTLQFFIYDRERQVHIVRVPTDLPRDAWCHMAMVSGKGGMRFYLNGALVGSDSFQGSFAAIGSGAFNYLGKSHWEENLDFLGELDEVRVWSAARSQAEIRATMHGRLDGAEEHLAALWNFDGDCGPEVIDGGPGKHAGRLMGDAYCAEEALPEVLLEPALLKGRITDASGRALAYAGVNLAQDGQWRAHSGTDVQGEYQIHVFDTGSHDVVARLGELGRWRQDLHFVPGQEYRVDISLTPSLDLHGHIQALDHEPLADVVIQALRQVQDGFPQVMQSAQSDERGNYRFFNLPPGTYYLRCHRQDHYVYAGDTSKITEAQTFAIGTDHRPQRVDFRFAPAEKGVWNVYATFEGLAVDEIRDIVRTADGLLWLASAGAGLWSFDGEEFTQYTTAQGLAHNQVNALCPSADGSLWVGTRSGVSHFADGVFSHYGQMQGLIDDEVNALYEEEDGGLWIGTANGVSRLVDGAFGELPFGESMYGKNVKAILRDWRGALWIASDDQGLWRYADGQLKQFSFREGLANFRVWALHEASGGTLWIGTDNGISRYDGESFTNHFSFEDEVADHRIRSIDEGAGGALYFATYGGGVLRLDGEYFLNLTQRDGLANDEVFAAYADEEGALWFGGNGGGLSRYDPRSLAHFDRAHGLVVDPVLSLAATDDGGAWVGTERGPMRFDGRTFERLGMEEGIDTPISSMIALGDSLLFGSADNQGGWLYADGRLTLVSGAGYLGTPNGSLEAVYRDHQGRIWFGTQTGVLRQGDDGLESFSESHGLAGNHIYAIGQDRDGEMWFASEKEGLSRWDGTRFTNYTTDDGLPSNLVRAIYGAADGRLWFGSYGGLSRWDGARFVNYTMRDGLGHNRVEAIAEDGRGRLRLATYGGGVSIYDGDAWATLDTRDGLPDDNIDALAVDANDRVWMGTEKGLIRYRPDTVPPRVRIVSVQTDSAYTVPDSIEAFAANTRVTIHYRAIDFETLPEKRQYRYRIIGRDEDWREPTREDHFEWTPQAAGEYAFEVQAIDRDLNYSEPARLTLHVVVPWYGNPWIVLPSGGGLFALLLVAIISSRRYYRTQREARLLRDQMLTQERKARTTLEAKNAELAASRDRIRQAQERAEGAAMEAEIARYEAEKAAEEATAANRAKSAFLANMSHELRTPLNAILGFAQLLERSTRLEKVERENLGIIHRSGEHLLALINDVLEMSRIEAGRTALEEAPFDLCKLLDSLADMFRLRAEGKGVNLRCAYDEELPRYVRADEGKLRQILINLLGNAVKFTEEGGVMLRTGWEAGQLHIEVVDTGPGIAPEEQGMLFKAFVQTQSGQQTQGGTGLGLAISQQFAQLMGGKIAVESQPGVGSTFRLDLPVALARADEVSRPEGARRVIGLAKGQPEWRILVVEDGADSRRLLCRLLESLGFQVREAEDGEEGIAAWREWRPHLIWMDMRMPVLDGYEATKRIKGTSEGQEIKIIALTANAFEEDRRQVLAAGCDDFVRKPFREEEVFAKMREHLGVDFVYADEEVLSEAAAELDSDALAEMPEIWRREMGDAASTADGETLTVLIEQIPLEQAGLARTLTGLVQDFRFDEIMRLTALP